MTEMKWEDPPESATTGPKGGRHSEVAEELRRNPGRWALIGSYEPSMAGNIRHGRVRAFRPTGSFEAVTRNVQKNEQGQRQADIYARYVGEGGS